MKSARPSSLVREVTIRFPQIDAAAGRYGDTSPGRAAAAAAAFREVVDEDAVVGWVAEAARAEAAGDKEGSDTLVKKALNGRASGAVPALKLLSAARITAEDLRDGDHAAFGEARYQHGMGAVWALCAGHRFDEAVEEHAGLRELLEPATCRRSWPTSRWPRLMRAPCSGCPPPIPARRWREGSCCSSTGRTRRPRRRSAKR